MIAKYKSLLNQRKKKGRKKVGMGRNTERENKEKKIKYLYIPYKGHKEPVYAPPI